MPVLAPLLLLLVPLQEPSVEELVDSYFSAEDREERRGIEKKLGDFPFADVEKAVRRGGDGRPVGKAGEVVVRTATTEAGKKEFEYHLYIPEEYDPKKRYRLFVSLHGQNGNGRDHIRLWLPDMKKRKDTFLAAPSVVGEAWGGTKRGHAHVLTLVKALVREFPIDPNQVWLGGVSMGGNGTFRVAGYAPERFAGLVPRIQGPRFVAPPQGLKKDYSNVIVRHVENLFSLPLYWIVGKEDPGVPIALMRRARDRLKALKYDVTFREMDGGHEAYPAENPGILAWMDGRAREPYPGRVVYHSDTKEYTRAYWVEISRFARLRSVKFRIYDFAGKVVGTRDEFTEEAKVRARLDREGNAIEADVENAAEIVFYLSDEMLDLDRPVVIRVNGKKVHDRKVKRSLRFLLEDAQERMDRGMIFSAKVKVRVP